MAVVVSVAVPITSFVDPPAVTVMWDKASSERERVKKRTRRKITEN